MILNRLLISLALTIGLSACASPYEKFYQSAPQSFGGNNQILPPQSEPRIGQLSTDPHRDILTMYEQGYALVGYSSFVGPIQNQNQALEMAKKVGAEVVLVGSKYRNTISGSMPITTPTSTTSYSNGTVNAYGSGGFASGNYAGSTTTYGTETSYIPYSIDKYDQGAFFFARLARKGLGIWIDRATDEQKQKANTNQLSLVTAVRNESPAFKADILAGDLLLTAGDEPVYDIVSLQKAVNKATNKSVDFTLLRNGKKLNKTIEVPESW